LIISLANPRRCFIWFNRRGNVVRQEGCVPWIERASELVPSLLDRSRCAETHFTLTCDLTAGIAKHQISRWPWMRIRKSFTWLKLAGESLEAAGRMALYEMPLKLERSPRSRLRMCVFKGFTCTRSYWGSKVACVSIITTQSAQLSAGCVAQNIRIHKVNVLAGKTFNTSSTSLTTNRLSRPEESVLCHHRSHEPSDRATQNGV